MMKPLKSKSHDRREVACKDEIQRELTLTNYSISQPNNAPAETQPHSPTDMQRTARALYKRGWNVFPVPRPHEVKAWAIATGKPREVNSKPPYIFAPLQRSRMYLGGEFMALFEQRNIAVMTGRTSGNLAIIDGDNIHAARQVEQELKARHICYWAYATGNGLNFIIRILEGESINLKNGTATLNGIEIWGHNRYCVIPESLHHSNAQYTWQDGIDPINTSETIEPTPIKDLEWLGMKLESKAYQDPELYGLPSWTVLLSKNNRRTLTSVIVEGYRNTRLTGPVYDLAAHVMRGNIDENDALELLYTAARNCEPAYSIRSIDSMWKSAINKRELIPATEYELKTGRATNQIYMQAVAFAQAYKWPGRTGQTDRAVFLALAERAKVDGPVFSAASRNVAELANCRSETAQKALRRLAKHEPPFIKLVSRDPHRQQPNKYKFVYSDSFKDVLKRTTINQLDSTGTVTHTSTRILAKQDVFAGLGRVALRCYEHLLQHPEMTISAIARNTMQNRSSVGRAINGTWKIIRDENGEPILDKAGKKQRVLLKPGLILHRLVSVRGLYMAEPVGETRLEDLSNILGTEGRAEKRRKYHEQTRQIRVNKQILWAQERWTRTIRGAR